MTRPTQFGVSFPQGTGIPGGDPALPQGQPVVDCCDDTDQPDRALDSPIDVGIDEGDLAFVQSKVGLATNATPTISATFDDDPTPGNLLIAALTVRATPGGTPSSTGWTLIGSEVDSTGSNGGSSWLFYRIADVAEPALVTFTGPTNYKRLTIAEFVGPGTLADVALMDEQASSISYPTGPVDIGLGILVGVVNVSENNFTFTDDAAFTEIAQGECGVGFDPSDITSYRIVTAGTYTWTPSGTTDTWCGVLAAFDSGAIWIGGGDGVTDDDDATYETIIGPNVIRMDLGAEYEIARTRLLIGTETAGARSYVISAANLPDFSDAVVIDTLVFTATGSYTPDDITSSWLAPDAYRYWQLTGDDETRRVFSWELYETANLSPEEVAALVDDVDELEADVAALQAIDYLVGTASGDLSSEIVVGTTPGGELGGTWASPTVDTTHSGSAHVALSSATPLVESGSGSAGSGTTASKADHVHPAAVTAGTILITDTPAGSPLVFADLLQNEAGTDLLYSDT